MSAPEDDAPSQTWESLDYEPSLPVSEKSNPLSRDMDRASANQIVRLLQACDAEMFRKQDAGGHYQGILDEAVLRSVQDVSQRAEQILKEPRHSLIVLSGCGTSGRLAYLTATSFNRALRELNQEPVYTYTIAGGDRALLTSEEAPEDDPTAGALCLKQVCEGKKRVLFIGISCGLSAPFVAGQLHHCLQHLDVFTPVLLGFNPENQARADPIRGCRFSFRDVLRRMVEVAPDLEAVVVLPVVGVSARPGSGSV